MERLRAVLCTSGFQMSGSLLPNAKSQFIDSTGKPLVNGKVYYYIPNTSTPKNTYQDQALTVLNTNPISLDANGQALIWGSGSYRQVVYDQNNNLVWDQVTAAQDWVTALGAGGTTSSGASQIGWDDQNLAYQITYRISRVVDSIALLRTLSHNAYTRVFVTGYYAAGDGGGGAYWYDPTDTTSTDNGGTTIVAADGGRWKLQWFGSVTVLQFGVKADAGTTDNSTTLSNCQAWVAANAVRNKLVFPAGKYGYSVSPNWAIQNATIEGLGEVHLQYSGTGNAVILDGTGQPNAGVYDMTFSGFTIDAPTTALVGFYVKNCHHSKFRSIKVRGAGASSAGIEVNGCVCSIFDTPEVSPNADGAWYTSAMPQYGMKFSGAVGAQASYCTILNPVMEGLAKATTGGGIYLEGALGNIFIGGTAEGCTTGIATATLTNGCSHNKFFGIDLEANTTYDIYENGAYNEYHSVDSALLAQVNAGALYNQFFGGSYFNITLALNATANGFFGVGWNRADISGTGSFTNGDSTTRIRDCFNVKTNAPGPFPQTSVAVGASPWTYTNSSGRDKQLSITGGSGVSMQYIRSGVGNGLSQINGLINLSPGDQLQITYTGTPAVWEYTR